MNNKFDELAMSLAGPVTRRRALKKFSIGLAGVIFTSLGLTNAEAGNGPWRCDCSAPYYGCKTKSCIRHCASSC